jgi:hypothetical protein
MRHDGNVAGRILLSGVAAALRDETKAVLAQHRDDLVGAEAYPFNRVGT